MSMYGPGGTLMLSVVGTPLGEGMGQRRLDGPAWGSGLPTLSSPSLPRRTPLVASPGSTGSVRRHCREPGSAHPRSEASGGLPNKRAYPTAGLTRLTQQRPRTLLGTWISLSSGRAQRGFAQQRARPAAGAALLIQQRPTTLWRAGTGLATTGFHVMHVEHVLWLHRRNLNNGKTLVSI